ncbi:MAG: hypothetical protein ACREC1_05780 [Methylovirgula sp.]
MLDRRWFSIVSLLAFAPLPVWANATNTTPQRYCAHVGNDDTLRPAPAALAGAIHRLFHISGKYALETTQYRCAGGKVLLCAIGANLPCGKANTSTELPGANDWCRQNPNSDFIPMFVTGHDTIYEWHCAGDLAKPGKKIGSVDARGFFQEYWKELR